jgi:hypothetical protein
VVEVVALAGALADSGEHRKPAVRLGDVVDQLHDDHRLADAGAAEQADLAALGVRREQVDDLDPGDQDLGLGRLRDKVGSRRVDGGAPLGADRPALVDRVADHVDDPPQRLAPHRHHDRAAGVDHLGAAHEPLGRVHRHRAHGILAEVLRHLQHQAVATVVGLDRAEDRRQLAVEPHVDHGADDLRNPADVVFHARAPGLTAKAPRRRK